VAAVASYTAFALIMLRIEMAAGDDVQALLDLQQQTQQIHWSPTAYQEAIALQQCWLAKQQQTIIGFIVFSHILDEAELLNIAVHPDYQGQGVAYALYAAMQEKLQQADVTQCFLEVAKSNHKAQTFYQKVGFTTIATRKNYYQQANGFDDAMIMRILL